MLACTADGAVANQLHAQGRRQTAVMQDWLTDKLGGAGWFCLLGPQDLAPSPIDRLIHTAASIASLFGVIGAAGVLTRRSDQRRPRDRNEPINRHPPPGSLTHAVQHQRGRHQGDVAERLREIAHEPLLVRVVLLAEQADIVA